MDQRTHRPYPAVSICSLPPESQHSGSDWCLYVKQMGRCYVAVAPAPLAPVNSDLNAISKAKRHIDTLTQRRNMPFTNDDVDIDMLMFNDRPSTMNENRRLAPKACFSCRTRKVRCDATRRGTPCTNCIRRSSCCMMTSSASSRTRNPVTSRLQNGTTASTPTASSESTLSDADYLFSLSFDGKKVVREGSFENTF